jgi:hypothetical protein
MKLIIYFFLLTCSAFAQFPEQHAIVLLSPSGEDLRSLERSIATHGGRVAVKHVDVWIVRIDAVAEEALRLRYPDLHIYRTAEHVDGLAASQQTSWLTRLLPGGVPDAEVTAEAGFECCSDPDHVGLPCGIWDETEDAAAVQASMRKSHLYNNTDPNKTSDILVGSTVVAVFCVNNVNAQQQGVPTWTEPLRGNAIANIMLNLAWWSDQAAEYGKQKSFLLREYRPDNPVCAIDFDPTEGYTHTSFSVNDHKFQNPIMDALGYSGANQTVKMRAFCNDLRAEEETDWAYLAFLLVGKNTVRAHASFGGPSTVLMANSAANGYVYAHETGHIFNAFDEYFEQGASNFRSRQSRFGVPNGNHHFRNHPVQPSMMAANYRTISGYTAVHLGLADSVRYITVVTDPPAATFEVEYIAPNDAVSNLGRFQGETRFAWGLGTRVRLRGLPSIGHSGFRYTNPVWAASGSNDYTLTVSPDTPQRIDLSYTRGSERTELSFEYLTLSNALASELVQDIYPLSPRSAAFVGQKGISIWNDTERIILDHPIGNRGGPVFRESYSIAGSDDGSLFFTSQASEILQYQSRSVSALTGPIADITYRNVTVSEDGALWATDGGVIGGRDMQASGVHRFSGGQTQAFSTSNSPLPSNGIVSIAPAGGASVWLGFGGKEAIDQGLFVFDPTSMTIENRSSLVAAPMISRIRLVGYDSLLVLSRSTEGTHITLIHDNAAFHWPASLFQGLGAVNDAVFDHQGRLAVATTQGLVIIDGDQQVFVMRTSNSELPANICYSLARGVGNGLFVGSNNGAVLITPSSTGATDVQTEAHPVSALLHEVYPNPVTQQPATVSYTLAEAGFAELRLYDLLGRPYGILSSGARQSGRHHVQLPASLPAGMYLLSLHTKDGVQTGKFQILR